jgi:3-oxoacyl-[acyl-carrier protein] reductase
VVVTGAAGALGAAIARCLGSEDGTAVVVSDIDEDGLQRTLASLADLPARAASVVADVGDAKDVSRLVDEAVERFGGLQVMVNNAGWLSPNARIHNLQPADWERAVRVNLMGVANGITAAVRVMRRRGGGSIVNTASIAGMTTWTHSAPYGACKAAVIHLTRMAALEYARDGVRVNCVCPGAFASAMHDTLPEAAVEGVVQRHPLGLGAPRDLVGAYAYLAGDESRWTTGAALVVDGGYSLT